jgi:BlaI family penicillinase repressor
MSRYPDLSDADSIIMEILWRDGETSSAMILGEIEGTLGWTRQTVRTYLKRLMDKGLVGTKEIKRRVFCYYPLVSRDDYAADKTGSFLNRYYDSNLAHMVAGIVKNEPISDSELDALETLIKELKNREG